VKFDVVNTQIPVRTEVAKDPRYLAANPTNEFFSSLVPVTHYRPAYALYPRISSEIQVAMESVMTGTARRRYGRQDVRRAGEGHRRRRGSRPRRAS